MSGRIFDSRIAEGIAPDDRARQDRLKATARALVTAVRDGLVRDGVVRLHGFGTFRLRPVAARRGRHPRTGEPIDIPAGWRVMFRPAKALRERVEPDRAPALPIGEPHASREAMLAASAAGAVQGMRRGAGRIPAAGIAEPPPMEPGRAAAAAMPETKFSVQGPVSAGPADLEADSRVTRSPAALTRVPAANEPPPMEPPAMEPTAAPDTTRRQNGYRYALVLLLMLLAAGLAWLFRPVDSPLPRTVEQTDALAPAEVPGDAERDAAGDQDAAVSPEEGNSSDEGGAVAGDPAVASPEATGSPGGPPEDTAAAAETVEAPATGARDPDGPAASDDGSTADGGGAGTAEPAVASTQASTGQVDTGDEVMTALSRAAEASGAAAANAGTVPDAAGADDTTPAGTDPMQTGTTETAADAPEQGGSAGEATPYSSGRDYTVRTGDTLWDLADRHYINPYYWPHIWNHNTGITNPNRLEVRQGLWLPALEGDPQSLTEADRRSIAEGYLRLYRFFRAQGDANPQYALVGVRYFDASVLPERLRGTAAGRPGDTLAAAFQARLEAEFPID